MPYKWEVKVGQTWHDLPNSEQIERDYCDPSNIHSSGNEPICFEEMTLGLDEVRRLSTKSSALLPSFVLTTSWIWYWKDEYNRWIQYASTIKRVQNRELWEDFMMKKEQMKIANKKEKYSERLLFHGTRSSLVDGVCHRNFDSQEFDASAYGKGIYFSKDARYWDERTDRFAVRLMFACRVLVGYYARGAARFHHPPAKNAEGSLYDSCVDDPRHPSVFVVFDRSQIYPEFLITYEENSKFEVERSGVSACDVSFAQVNVKETSQTSRATEQEQTSVITNWASCTSSLKITPTTGSASSLKGPDSDPEHTHYGLRFNIRYNCGCHHCTSCLS